MEKNLWDPELGNLMLNEYEAVKPFSATEKRLLYILLLTGRLMLDTSDFHSDPLDKTFGKKIINFISLHIKKLILQRGASTVKY